MHLRVEQMHLQTALQTVARAVSLRTPQPILSGVMFETVDNNLRLTATDQEITIQMTVPAQVQDEGRIVLPGRYVHEIVRRIPAGLVDLILEPESLRVTMRWDRSKYVVNGMPPEKFTMPGTMSGEGLMVPTDVLRTLFKKTVFAAANEETRPTLTGVYLTVDDSTARALATDGFRVAIGTVPTDGADSDGMILPGRSLTEIGRILQNVNTETVLIRKVENQVEFELDGIRILSRLVAGPYPNIFELLPDDYPQKVLIDRDALVAALDRAALLADGRSSSRWLVLMTIGADRLTIAADDPEVGQALEEVNAETHGEGLQIAFNARYLLEGVRQIEDQRVEMSLIDPGKAVRLQGEGNDSYQYIVFPILL